MQSKTMEQPQQEWWISLLKWAQMNTPGFLIAGICFKFIDSTSKFLTRLVDGRLKKISQDVTNDSINEKIIPINKSIDELRDQIQFLTELMMGKK